MIENTIGGRGVSSAPAVQVAYCGEAGAYAEQALMRFFGEDVPRLAVSSFPGIFDAVLDGTAAAGVVPVENSLTGSVHENFDLFLRYPGAAIVGELKLRIVHCLIANRGADMESIRVVRSHPQGFAQCREFLDTHPGWTLEPATTTATAAASVARDGTLNVAAIAGEIAARIHGLELLREGIETNPQNYTRFAIIARRCGGTAPAPLGPGSVKANKASLVLSIPDKPSSLFACLGILNEKGINLSKLESRPIPGRPWEYLFYMDVSIPEEEGIFDSTIAELKAKTVDFHFLGSYRASS